jgi:hypothetical protein
MALSITAYIKLKYKLNYLQNMVVGIISLCLAFSIFGKYYSIDTLEFWVCLILGMIMSDITIDRVAKEENLDND